MPKLPEEVEIMADFYFVTCFSFSTKSMYYNQKKRKKGKSNWPCLVVSEEKIGPESFRKPLKLVVPSMTPWAGGGGSP